MDEYLGDPEDLEHLDYSDLGDLAFLGYLVIPVNLVDPVRPDWTYPGDLDYPEFLVNLAFPDYLGVPEYPEYPEFLGDLAFPDYPADLADLGYLGHLD